MAKYSFSIDRDWNWIASRLWAWSCRATRIAPLVSRSRRCTMPGRNGPPLLLRLGPKWNCSALTSVPDQCPRAGCTTMPGGLLTTTRSSSSKRISKRNLFGPRGLAGNFRQDDPHPLPRTNAIGRLSAVVVDVHAAGRNHAPQMDPAVVVKVQGKQNVQTLAGLACIDDELDRLVRERRVTRDVGQISLVLLLRCFRFRALRPSETVRASCRLLALRGLRLRRLWSWECPSSALAGLRGVRLRRVGLGGQSSAASASRRRVGDGSGVVTSAVGTAG